MADRASMAGCWRKIDKLPGLHPSLDRDSGTTSKGGANSETVPGQCPGENIISDSLEAGELYYVRWPNDGMLYLSMIVPGHNDDARRFGLPVLHRGLKGLGLLDRRQVSLPKCYIIDRRYGTITGWAEGFEDGGPKELEREFPALFFDQPEFSAAWIKASWAEEHFDYRNPKYHDAKYRLENNVALASYAAGQGFPSFDAMLNAMLEGRVTRGHTREPQLAQESCQAYTIPGSRLSAQRGDHQRIDSILVGPMLLSVNESRFDFSLPHSEFYEVAPREISSGIGFVLRGYCEGSRRVCFRVCRDRVKKTASIMSQWSTAPTTWPPVIVVMVNGKSLLPVRRNHHGYDVPCDITVQVNPGQNTVSVVVANLGLEYEYYGAVELCRPVPRTNT